MTTKQRRLECISIYSESAENWRGKGSPEREAMSLASLLMNYLALSVFEFRAAPEAKAWLEQEGVRNVLRRYCEIVGRLWTQFDANGGSGPLVEGNYRSLVFMHMAWILAEWELGNKAMAFATRQEVLEVSTPFWQSYAMAMYGLLHKQWQKVSVVIERPQEVYWVPYRNLVEVALETKRIDSVERVDSAVLSIDEAFRRRATDKNFADDAYEIEGSYGNPASWDFRKDSLLAALCKK